MSKHTDWTDELYNSGGESLYNTYDSLIAEDQRPPVYLKRKNLEFIFLGERLILSPIKFFILYYLVTNLNDSIHPGELAEYVYDEPADESSINTIQSHISVLRVILNKTFVNGREFIRTEDEGYRFMGFDVIRERYNTES